MTIAAIVPVARGDRLLLAAGARSLCLVRGMGGGRRLFVTIVGALGRAPGGIVLLLDLGRQDARGQITDPVPLPRLVEKVGRLVGVRTQVEELALVASAAKNLAGPNQKSPSRPSSRAVVGS